jgi:hypothetical protein
MDTSLHPLLAATLGAASAPPRPRPHYPSRVVDALTSDDKALQMRHILRADAAA